MPVDRYRLNLECMIDQITNKWGLDKSRLILISPPKINDSGWQVYCEKMGYEQNHFDALATEFAKACVLAASQSGVACLDMNRLMGERGQTGFDELLIDGLHFSKLGSQFLFEHLKPMVESTIGRGLRANYPNWKDIDPVCPILKQ